MGDLCEIKGSYFEPKTVVGEGFVSATCNLGKPGPLRRTSWRLQRKKESQGAPRGEIRGDATSGKDGKMPLDFLERHISPHEASLLVCYYTGKEKALFKRYTILMVILAAAPLREEKAPGAAAN